jgi:nicotinamidase-related amidase
MQNSPLFRAAVEAGALVEGSWGAEFHDKLKPRRGEFVVTHSRINGFFGSDLEVVLATLRARRVIVAGVATADADLHAASLRTLERVASVDEILSQLGPA